MTEIKKEGTRKVQHVFDLDEVLPSLLVAGVTLGEAICVGQNPL